MLEKIIVLVICSLITNFTIGQSQNDYQHYIAKADSLYSVKAYKLSAEAYEKAIDANKGKAYSVDRYNAACSFALSDNADFSFFHLFYLASHPRLKYNNYDHIIKDSDLISLHKNEKWKPLITIIEANKKAYEKDFDKPLMAILEEIHEEDQKYRKQIIDIEKEFGRDSDEMKKHWTLINEKDSINLIKVQKILDERGWLGANVVGNKGNSTLFLVIQHSSLEIQEQYLPMMRAAVKDGNARSSSLALLEDRVALRKGGKQIYGSQIGRDQETGEYYVLPLVDPLNVDIRRNEVGLEPIADYIKNWDMAWDVQKHIARNELIQKKEAETKD